MWMRLLCELQARRITQLEQEVQGRKPRVVVIGEEGETSSNELD